MSNLHLMVIDDEPDLAAFVAEVAESLDYRTTVVSDADRVLEAVGSGDMTHIALDLVMPGTDGIEVLRMLAEKGCTAEIVLMSGFDKQVLATAAQLARTFGLRVLGYLEKPIRLDALETLLGSTAQIRPERTTMSETCESISEGELVRAIREEQFVLHYQPQIEIATGHLAGAEALVRWQHPDRGLVFPDRFIGLMEEAGLIDALGWLVIRNGLADLRSLGPPETLRLSFNVSARSLHDLALPDRLLELVREQGIPPKHVVLEITESGLMRELAKALDILSRLRVKGFQLSIDDFGTGYAMMQQLRLVPANEIKLDRSFVQDAAEQQSARVVVEKTIELGHALGMRVVAEGVETTDQLEFLRSRGCDIAQGYLFSRPVPLAEFRGNVPRVRGTQTDWSEAPKLDSRATVG